MAGGMDLGTPTRGGKKPLDAAINLVPFIDLMAVTISFLIYTAVWSQTGRIQVSQGGGVPSDANKRPPIALQLSAHELKLSAEGAPPLTFTLKSADGKLELKRLTDAIAPLAATTSQVSIRADDDVRYDDLVQVIDACISAGASDVSVET